MTEPNDLIRPRDAARILGISAQTIYRLIHSGDLAAVRVGDRLFRIRRADLDAYVNQRLRDHERNTETTVERRKRDDQE